MVTKSPQTRMLDKVSVSLAIIALLVGSASLAYVVPLGGNIDRLTRSQEDLKASLDREVQGLRTELSTERARVQEAQKQIEAAKAEAEFLDAARKEALAGPLIMYGSMDLPDMLEIVWPGFKARYPFVGDIQYIEGFTDLLTRFQEEAARGVRTADVRVDSGVRAFSDHLKGLGLAWTPKSAGLYAQDQIVDQTLHNSWSGIGVIVYNTDLVKPADAPKSWADLADPKWKGKIITGDPRLGGSQQNHWASIWQNLGDEKFKALIKGVFVDNKATVIDRWGSSEYVSVLSGEHYVGTSLINDYLQQRPGTPVGIASPSDGASLEQNFIYVHKNTPKPNLGKLFVDWFLSEEGQTLVGKTGRSPALRTLDSPSSLKNAQPGVNAMITNLDNYKDPAGWRQKFAALFSELGIPGLPS